MLMHFDTSSPPVSIEPTNPKSTTMNHQRSFSFKFRRRKSSKSTSRLLLSSSSSVIHRPNMLSLPTELYARLLENASFADLCAFRATCRTCHRLLSSGEIVRRWLGKNGNKQQLSLYPPPNPPSFQYVLEQQWRGRTADATAAMIAVYIEREVLRHTLLRLDVFPTRSREEVLHTTTMEVQRKLVPLVLTMQHYLEHFAEALMVDFALPEPGSEKDMLSCEREIFESYDPHHLLQVHKFWLFLYWLLNRILSRESSGTSSLREPFNRYQIRLMLVLGNTTALMSLLGQETPKRRLQAAANWLRRLDPDLSLLWQRRWQENVFGKNKPCYADEAHAILTLRLRASEVWAGGARTVLMEKGMLPKKTGEEIGTPWQALDFLCDIAGYDALQTTPSLLQLSRVLLRPE